MVRKPPRIDHVKHVPSKGRWYSYFNTGQKTADGQPIRKRLPDWGTPQFWDSYAAFKAAKTKREAPGYTVASLVDEYRKSPTFSKLAGSTQKNYANQLQKVVDVWGKFPVNELTPKHIRMALEGEGWGAGTRNMVVAVIGVIYKWGRRNERAVINPVQDIERAELGEHDPWPEHILEAALKADDDLTRLAVHLLYFTGQRIGDVCKLRWTDIRDDHIWVRQTKTGKEVEPPLTAELQAELARHPKSMGPIITGINEMGLRRRLQRYTRALGVETVPHGLRKNAVNALLEAGCTIAEVAAITGQTHQIVEKYAAKVNRRRLGKAAIVKLEAHRKQSA